MAKTGEGEKSRDEMNAWLTSKWALARWIQARAKLPMRWGIPNAIPLKDGSVEIQGGDAISVIGPSGTGKSTLLRCINQLENPSSGRVWVGDTEITDPKCDINKVRQKMGMVFQSFNLFGQMTVIENIMLSPIELLGKAKQEAYDEGMRLLRMVGLAEKSLNYPDELSGGQKQRIAIARTLAMDPDIILFDEPTSALDPTMVDEVEAVIRELAKTGKTLMIATHEMAFARAISNRVFYMDEDGIYEDGAPEQVFDNPVREKTRRFVRRLKVLEQNIENRDYDYIEMETEIDRYCKKNQIPKKISNRIQLVFEELVQKILIQILDPPHINIVTEYSEQERRTTMTALFNNPPTEITPTIDEPALSILKGLIPRYKLNKTESEEYPNQLKMEITVPDEKSLNLEPETV